MIRKLIQWLHRARRDFLPVLPAWKFQRPLDERLYIAGNAGLREWVDRRAKHPRFHSDCSQCCAIGRCHWDVSTPSRVAIFRAADGYTYRACGAHLGMLLSKALNIGHQYDELARTPPTLRYETEGR